MKTTHWVFTLLLVCWQITPQSISAGQWQGHQESVDGILHVLNEAVTTDSPVILSPPLLWHIGDDEDLNSELFGHIIDIAVDSVGNSYLLDETMIVVKMFDPLGNFIRDLGRQGEGPGEFNMPRRVSILADGSLGVIQTMPGRIVKLDQNNIPLDYFSPPSRKVGGRRFSQVRSSLDYNVVSRSISKIEDNLMTTRHSLDFHDRAGKFIATVMEDVRQTRSRGMSIDNGREFNSLASCWDLSSDGRLFVAPFFNQYKILVFDRRSAENMAKLELQNEQLRRADGRSEDLNPYVRDIDQLFCHPNGELWVLSSQGLQDCPDHQLGSFHVYDTSGHYLYEVNLQVDYNAERDDFILARNRLFILKESKMMPATVTTASYGNSMVMGISQGPAPEDIKDDEEARPFSIICYKLER